MKTKLTVSLLSAFAMAITGTGAFGVPTTYDVIKASASLSGFLSTTNADSNFILLPSRLSTSGIINLARGRAYNAKVPKNEMLGVAANYGNTFGSGNGPGMLVVVDTTNAPSLVVLARIIIAAAPANVTFNEEWTPKTFKRVGLASMVFSACGNPTNGFQGGGALYGSGILTRTPSPTGPIPKVQMTFSGTGFVNMAGYKKQNFVNTRFYITAGKFSGSGKIVGNYTE